MPTSGVSPTRPKRLLVIPPVLVAAARLPNRSSATAPTVPCFSCSLGALVGLPARLVALALLLLVKLLEPLGRIEVKGCCRPAPSPAPARTARPRRRRAARARFCPSPAAPGRSDSAHVAPPPPRPPCASRHP